jgi:hypothetical protein
MKSRRKIQAVLGSSLTFLLVGCSEESRDSVVYNPPPIVIQQGISLLDHAGFLRVDLRGFASRIRKESKEVRYSQLVKRLQEHRAHHTHLSRIDWVELTLETLSGVSYTNDDPAIALALFATSELSPENQLVISDYSDLVLLVLLMSDSVGNAARLAHNFSMVAAASSSFSAEGLSSHHLQAPSVKRLLALLAVCKGS